MNGFSGIEAECEFVGVVLDAGTERAIVPMEHFLQRQARIERVRRIAGQCGRFVLGGVQGAGLMYGAPSLSITASSENREQIPRDY